jgi:hypothetical protein
LVLCKTGDVIDTDKHIAKCPEAAFVIRRIIGTIALVGAALLLSLSLAFSEQLKVDSRTGQIRKETEALQ